MKQTRTTLLTVLFLISALLPSLAQAQAIWTEVGDAGHLISTAQSTAGTGPLLSIEGDIWPVDEVWDVDIYCIDITDPTHFSATLGASPDGTEYNPLFLFSSNPLGSGVTVQEGFYAGPTPTLITGQFVTTPGIYYLAIGMHDLYPLDSASAPLWSFISGIEQAPTNLNPLHEWWITGGNWQYGAYTIFLTGAEHANCEDATASESTNWGSLKTDYR